MSLLINDIIKELKNKEYYKDKKNEWWNTSIELERILDSEFKYITKHMQSKNLKEVNIIYLGKIKPSKWLIYNRERVYGKSELGK